MTQDSRLRTVAQQLKVYTCDNVCLCVCVRMRVNVSVCMYKVHPARNFPDSLLSRASQLPERVALWLPGKKTSARVVGRLRLCGYGDEVSATGKNCSTSCKKNTGR